MYCTFLYSISKNIFFFLEKIRTLSLRRPTEFCALRLACIECIVCCAAHFFRDGTPFIQRNNRDKYSGIFITFFFFFEGEVGVSKSSENDEMFATYCWNSTSHHHRSRFTERDFVSSSVASAAPSKIGTNPKIVTVAWS